NAASAKRFSFEHLKRSVAHGLECRFFLSWRQIARGVERGGHSLPVCGIEIHERQESRLAARVTDERDISTLDDEKRQPDRLGLRSSLSGRRCLLSIGWKQRPPHLLER